jgi:lipopolysaccharide export system permease protein
MPTKRHFALPLKVYWYTTKEVAVPFLGGFFFFMFVFLMFQAVRLADYFINHGAGVWLLVKLTVFISTAFLPVVLPISFLVATLVGFGRLSADSEIIALKATGISLSQLYLPVLALSLLVSGTLFYFTNYFIPWGNLEFKRTVFRLGNTKAVANLKEGTFTEGFFDMLVYAEKVNMTQNSLSGVFIYDERDPKNPLAIVAKSGTIIPQKTESELGVAAVFKLVNGAIHRPDLGRGAYEKIDFNEYRILLKVEEGHVGEITVPKTLPSKTLLKKMAELEGKAGFNEHAIEYWKRVALSVCPIVFGLLGLGLGVVRSRSVKSYSLAVAIAVIAGYWILHVVGTSLAESGSLPPFWAMQLSNIAVIPLAVVSFKRSNW